MHLSVCLSVCLYTMLLKQFTSGHQLNCGTVVKERMKSERISGSDLQLFTAESCRNESSIYQFPDASILRQNIAAVEKNAEITEDYF